MFGDPELDKELVRVMQNGYRAGSLYWCENLLNRGADVNARSKGGGTVIIEAAKNDRLDIVQLLLKEGALVNAIDSYGMTALMWVAGKEYINSIGASPLRRISLCSGIKHQKILQLLLEKGASVNVQNNAGYTALMFAALSGNAQIAQLLLTKRADINVQNKDGNTTLILAVYHGRTELVQLLFEKRADANETNNLLQTPLHFATEKGRTEIIKLLLMNGADVDAKSRYKETPLKLAAENGHLEIVKLLLLSGANVDNHIGEMSALSRAVKNGHIDIGKLLLMYGAPPFKSQFVQQCIKQINAEISVRRALEKYKQLYLNFTYYQNHKCYVPKEIWNRIFSLTANFDAAGLSGGSQEITQKLTEIIKVHKDVKLGKKKAAVAKKKQEEARRQTGSALGCYIQ